MFKAKKFIKFIKISLNQSGRMKSKVGQDFVQYTSISKYHPMQTCKRSTHYVFNSRLHQDFGVKLVEDKQQYIINGLFSKIENY